MKQISILFFLLMAVAMDANSQTVKETPFIEVSAKAEQEIMPDEITISIIILDKINGTEKVTIEAREAKLTKELKAIGIDMKNFTPADAGNLIKVRPAVEELPKSKTYLLKVENVVTAKKVFSVLEKLEILSARISKVSYSKMDELKKETRIKAMKTAKEKADYMLSAVGEQTGKAIAVQEKEIGASDLLLKPVISPINSSEAILPSFSLPVPEGFFEIKKIKIQTEVVVKFEIK